MKKVYILLQAICTEDQIETYVIGVYGSEELAIEALKDEERIFSEDVDPDLRDRYDLVYDLDDRELQLQYNGDWEHRFYVLERELRES